MCHDRAQQLLREGHRPAERGRLDRPAESRRLLEVSSRRGPRRSTDRIQLRKTIDRLEADDILLITRFNRPARSTCDLLNTLATIAEKGAEFRSLGDGGANATAPHGRLMLTVLGGMVEFDRERILVLDVRMGPKPKLSLFQRHEALRR
ncbi:recombinase family protein [Acidiphilium multivorum]|uniref:Putative recombinase n=2 Tax=Acidiphilium multivorum TaxID=62140 RepID=F0J830_ACIMA|nr:recombinase family protein [Acidiphilium multivorum]BAJ83247.1 putative recombinase [Acidiphilium multivorum AIU301]